MRVCVCVCLGGWEMIHRWLRFVRSRFFLLLFKKKKKRHTHTDISRRVCIFFLFFWLPVRKWNDFFVRSPFSVALCLFGFCRPATELFFFLGFLLYFSIFFFLIEFDVSVAGPGAILFLLRRPGYRVYQVS